MSSQIMLNTRRIRADSSSITIQFFHEIKVVINRFFESGKVSLPFVPKCYTPADYILPKLYALVSDKSTDDAAEELNIACSKRQEILLGRKTKTYKDGKRFRRFIPHQTDIDKFFRGMDENSVKMVFMGILDYLNEKIQHSFSGKRTWQIIADNTKYPYYGKINKQKHIKCPKLPGTKYAWMFQGITLHSENIQLFVNFHSLTHKVYRCKDIPADIQWQKFQDIRISRILIDREFYRVQLFKNCKQLHVPLISPCKKFPAIRNHMVNFLHGNAEWISHYLFTQGAQQYPNQNYVLLYLVLVGHKNQTAFEIRQKYQMGHWSLEKALNELEGFFTTIPPWNDRKAYGRFLRREYKDRWWIETGFCDLNQIHTTTRARQYYKKLAEITMDGWIYNHWQWERACFSWGHKGVVRMPKFKQFLEQYTAVLRKFIIGTCRLQIKYYINRN